ncbi:MAG: NTP transferase domain-containing protein [Halobacteriales archaeon]
MCGGRGSRFEADVEKPLFPVGDRPMVDRVRDALVASRINTVHAVVSPQAPATRDHLDDISTIQTPGNGYVADLEAALVDVPKPVLTVAADLPLLDGPAIDTVLDDHADGPMTVAVPAALKRQLGVSLEESLPDPGEELAPAGVNVVADGVESTHTTYDARFAVNVNRRSDVAVAEALL